MKSYFSQLVNQSALRYRQANSVLRASSSEKSSREFAPLHREETIFTEPVSAQVDAPQNEKKEINKSPFLERTSSESETKSLSKIEAKPTENVSVEFPNKSQAGDTKITSLPPSQNSVSDNRNIYQAEQIQNEILSEKKSGESASVVPPDLAADEQLIFKENEATRRIEQTNASETQIRFQPVQREFQSAQTSFQSAQNEFQPEVSASIEVESTDSVLSQPEYFKKTAANLEAGTADKSAIQQILLQEIYEWTSGAPVDPPQAKKNELRELSEVRVIAAQPSETRAFFEEKEAAQNAAQNPVTLKEQNFELSIGNISITVEEPPPPVRNTTVQNTASDKTTTAAPREFSRLSRYYL